MPPPQYHRRSQQHAWSRCFHSLDAWSRFYLVPGYVRSKMSVDLDPPFKLPFSSITKWQDVLNALFDAHDISMVSEIVEMPEVILDKRLVDAVLVQWRKLKQTFAVYSDESEMTTKTYLTSIMAEIVPLVNDSMNAIFEMEISEEAFNNSLWKFTYSAFPAPCLQFEGKLDFAIIRNTTLCNIPLFLTVVTTAGEAYGRVQHVVQLKSCYEFAKSLCLKVVEHSVVQEVEAETLAAIQRKCDDELPPDLEDPAERNNRINVIEKQCRKQAAISRRQESQKKFADLMARCPLCIYGVVTTA